MNKYGAPIDGYQMDAHIHNSASPVVWILLSLLLISGCSPEVSVWTLMGQKVATIEKHINHCYKAEFSPDDQWLLTYRDEKMALFGVSEGTGQLRQFQGSHSQPT